MALLEDVRDAFKPCEVMCKCLGLLPLYFRKELTFRQKILNYVHLVVIYGLITCCTVVCMPKDMVYYSLSMVMNQSVILLIVAYYVQPFCNTVFCWFLSDKIFLVLESIGSSDVELADLGTRMNIGHQKQFIRFFTNMATAPMCVIFMTTYYLHANMDDLCYLLASMYYSLHHVIVCGLAGALGWLLHKRYQALCDTLLRMYFPTTPTSGGFLTTTTTNATTATGHAAETAVCSEKEQLTVLRQIKILHDKLNDVVELVNYCFSVQITFCVGLCFVIGVVCSFGLFRAFIYRNELFYMGVLNFIWYMYYLFFVLFFIAVGSKITREGKRIGVLVHKAINCSTSTAVINELNIFSQQLLHRSPVITCGLFVYDWTLLYTMIGATATYLIILIQFDVSFPNLVNVNGTATTPGV